MKAIETRYRGKRAISADTALRLARYFGTTPGIWLRLQARYDLELAEEKLGKQIDREVKVLKAASPVRN
jgi:plasmid maintenance system antidote protein VapI